LDLGRHRGIRLLVQQPLFASLGNCLRAAANAQLAVELLVVPLDCLKRDEEFLRDLAI